MRVRPLLDWLVVHLDPLPEETRGGIVLPQNSSGAERQRTGTVLRVGPGRWLYGKNARRPMGVQEGDRVCFFRENLEHQQGKAIQRVLQDLEDNVGMIREDDILYVLEKVAHAPRHHH
jgi:co-chaperonin GroES (HSP10)